MMGFVVEESFEIAGRGVAVLLNERVEQPLGYTLHARISRPDGSTVEAQALREMIRRVKPEPHERESFLLAGLAKDAVPVGSQVEFEPVPDWGPRA